MNALYSGSASFGKVTTIIGFIITLIIFSTTLVTGIYFAFKKKEYTIPKKVKLNEPFTRENKIKVITEDNCQSLLTGVSEKNYPFLKDNTITAYSNKKEGCSKYVHLTSDDTITHVGITFIVFSIFILIIDSLHLYLVFKYKPYAAYEGVSSGIDALTGFTHLLTK